jgi:curved DNA-binding protein CbpA
MTRTLYAVLNVAPDADPAVIEAAYKALMKKYHPDRLGPDGGSDERRAAEINEAFQVLRDPDRRARYDGDARARQEHLRRAAYAAPPPVYAAAPSAGRGSRWRTVLMLLLLAGLLYYFWDDIDRLQGPIGSANPFASQATAARPQNGAVRIADVERAVAEFQDIKGKSGLLGLSAFSQDCFAAQARSFTLGDLDFCVAFDHAAADYGAKIAGDDLPQLPRFAPEELDIRHQSAARLISGDPQWINARLMQLRSMTAERLKGPPVAPAAVVQPAMVAAAASAGALVRSSPPRYRPSPPQRYRRPAQLRRPAQRAPSRDRDFLEREGYIY